MRSHCEASGKLISSHSGHLRVHKEFVLFVAIANQSIHSLLKQVLACSLFDGTKTSSANMLCKYIARSQQATHSAKDSNTVLAGTLERKLRTVLIFIISKAFVMNLDFLLDFAAEALVFCKCLGTRGRENHFVFYHYHVAH